MELRNKALELTVDLVTARTVDDLIGFLRKELIKACGSAASSSTENGSWNATRSRSSDEDIYRHALVRTIRAICMKFPNCLSGILPTLCEVSLIYRFLTCVTNTNLKTFLSQTLTYAELQDSMAAIEVCRFFRDAVFRHPQYKSLILEKIFQVLPIVAGCDVLRHLIWLCGESCTNKSEILECMQVIHQVCFGA